MLAWISENPASPVLLPVAAAIVFPPVRGKMKERKQGACGCEGCSGRAAHNKGGKI